MPRNRIDKEAGRIQDFEWDGALIILSSVKRANNF